MRGFFGVIALSLFGLCLADEWKHIPFDEAMRKSDFPYACSSTKEIVGIDGDQLYAFFNQLYDKNSSLLFEPSVALKIPHIIHQIWLGSDVPESFIQLQQSWIEKHYGRGWLYKLWTDEDIEEFGLYNKEFYDATDNYGVKSDIARWEIIHRYGGVYVDMDFECLQPLDQLHYTYDFYVGLQPLDTLFVQLGAALFGARPGHPILKHCIETIKNDWHHKGAPKKTGPVHFTKSFLAYAGHDDSKDIAFPAFYFYPLSCRENEARRDEWIEKGAIAVHWWAKSWMPKNYRPSQFKNIANDASTVSWND